MEEELRQRIHNLECEKEDLNIHIQHLEQDFEQERDGLNAKLIEEKEKNKKLEEEKDLFVKSYIKARDDEANTVINSHRQLELLNKVIDLMVEDISNSDIDEDICRQYATKEKRCAEGNNQKECVKCIREYYFKKARGE